MDFSDGDTESSCSLSEPQPAPADNRFASIVNEIAEIWCDVLGVDVVRETDDFFDLGGDSLASAQLLTRIGRRYRLRVSESELFTARTVGSLARLICNGTMTLEEGPPLVHAAEPRVRFLATSAQRRLWVLDQVLPNPEVYNVVYLVRFDGEIDPQAMRSAVAELEKRHEPLRTHFVNDDGAPWQVVDQDLVVPFSFVDVRAVPDAEADIVRRCIACASSRFDLSGKRIWRMSLYQAKEDSHYLWLNFHHTIVDGYSIGVLFRELETLYLAKRQGRTPKLPALPVEYGDYATWEAQWRQSPAYRHQLDHWKQVLAPLAPPLDLPYARSRPKWQTYTGSRTRFEVPDRLVAAIDRLCAEHAVTRFMVGLAAFQVVLHRLTGQQSIVLGTPVANRSRPETADLIGMFVNTVALRTELSSDLTFLQLLDRVRRVRLDAMAHQDVSLESLIEELRPPRDPSRQPIFQVAYYYQNVTIVPDRFAGMAVTRVPVHNGTAMFDLRMVLEDGPGNQVWGWVEQNVDLIDEQYVSQLISQFQTVLEAATAEPIRKIGELPLLAPDDYRKIVFDWNQTAGDYPDRDRLPDGFLRQASTHPTHVALVSNGKSTTYAQLLARSNQIAQFLRSRGVGPGDLVGICLKRSVEMIAAVLGTSMAGAAYVPLDPSYPRDRLAFMLDDTAAKLVITQWSLVDRLPIDGDRLVNLDQLAPEIARFPAKWNDRVGSSKDIAYVIYTSGSTGRPKGVVVRHQAAINTIDWVNRVFEVGQTDRLLFVTSLSFDLSVFDIFGVLGAGGCLRIADEGELKDPAQLAEVLRTEGITMWDSAPAALQQVMPFLADRGPTRTLRLTMLSGDWVPVKMPDQIRQAFPNAKVMVLGGATEAAIWSNWFPVERVDPAWPSIPYGRPIRNACYHVLGADLTPMPVGVAGELHIGGVCLAEGYLNRPELTAERFIASPFTAGERLYKTGDLARYLPDGNIEFLGRIDQQVKVRGFRVEIGEVESALAQHARVRECCVKAFKDESGVQCLAAYVVAASSVEVPELITHLRGSLPEYMIPSAFVYLDALPVTNNGKLDRAALPAPNQQARSAEVVEVELPSTDAERALLALWEESLNIRPISVTARFEDLGGHSLLAAQIISRIETRLGHKIPLEVLFTTPTIRGLATLIQQKLELGGGVIVPLNEAGEHPPLFMIAGAGGHVFAFHKFSRLLGTDFPVYGMKAIGVDGSEPPLDRIEAIASRYADEMTRFRPHGPYVLAGYSVGGLVAYELACQLRQRGMAVEKVIVFDSNAPGYPRRQALPVRAMIHLSNFWRRKGPEKWAYVSERWHNVRHRLMRRLGLGHLDVKQVARVGGLSEQTLKRVWSSLERAMMRYWPTRMFDGPIVLVRARNAAIWAATKMDDPHKGWDQWTTASVEVVDVPSDHMNVFGDEHLDTVVREVRAVLEHVPPTVSIRRDSVVQV